LTSLGVFDFIHEKLRVTMVRKKLGKGKKNRCRSVSVQATVLLSSALFKMLSNAPALWL